MGLSLRLPWARHLIAHGLYVSPQARRCGRASTVLFAAAEAARRHGLPGLSIQTSWLWQDSLRFAMAAGFWYDRWKHEIQLVLIPDGRAWSFGLDDSSAVFEVRERGRCTLKFVARRDDTRLVLTEPGTPDSDELSSYFRALGTFSLMLALHGWPLIRSDEEWSQSSSFLPDSGQPELFASMIASNEAYAKKVGWPVRSKKIPGLSQRLGEPE